MRFV
jgi:hypothetical protein